MILDRELSEMYEGCVGELLSNLKGVQTPDEKIDWTRKEVGMPDQQWRQYILPQYII